MIVKSILCLELVSTILLLSLMFSTAQKMKFSIKDFFVKCFLLETADSGTFTEDVLNKKLRFLCSVHYGYQILVL